VGFTNGRSCTGSITTFNVKLVEAGVVNLLCSDTEEALELLPLSPICVPRSPLLNLRSSSSSDLFKD
jgi:hypothetical protein